MKPAYIHQARRQDARTRTPVTWLLVCVTLAAPACAAPKSTTASPSCTKELVAATPPDTLPSWFQDDSSWGNVYLKHIIAVRFDSTATTADRRHAIEAVCGRVMGGWRLAGPTEDIYAVQVADGGDQGLLVEFVELIKAQPGVVSAGMEPKLTITPH